MVNTRLATHVEQSGVFYTSLLKDKFCYQENVKIFYIRVLEILLSLKRIEKYYFTLNFYFRTLGDDLTFLVFTFHFPLIFF